MQSLCATLIIHIHGICTELRNHSGIGCRCPARCGIIRCAGLIQVFPIIQRYQRVTPGFSYPLATTARHMLRSVREDTSYDSRKLYFAGTSNFLQHARRALATFSYQRRNKTFPRDTCWKWTNVSLTSRGNVRKRFNRSMLVKPLRNG